MTYARFLTPLFLAGAFLSAAPLAAQTMITGNDIDEIVNLARGYGSAVKEADSQGDPKISGRINGISYVVLFYGCTNNTDCTSIQFQAAWANPGHVTADMLNEWNRDKRFGKAYLDDENDPVIEWDVNLFGGVSARNMDDTIDWWKLVLTTFAEEMS